MCQGELLLACMGCRGRRGKGRTRDNKVVGAHICCKHVDQKFHFHNNWQTIAKGKYERISLTSAQVFETSVTTTDKSPS